MTAANIVLGLTMVLFALVWLIVVLTNILRAVKVARLEGPDKPENRGWIVFGLSVASLFSGCCLALITWVVMEWVFMPLDPFEDSLGTIQLTEKARSNVAFVIVSNLILLLVVGLARGVMGT